MPFRSRSQQRWMFATHPAMAKEWADHTPDIKSLPEKVHKTFKGSKKDVHASVYQHPDKLGAGAKKRKGLNKSQDIHAVMHEFKTGTLRSGSGAHVSNRQQAIAIALSEARRKK